MNPLTVCTIGFTRKSLRNFVGLLNQAEVEKVIDIRLRNTSQLAGYSKKDDLAFVLDLCGIAYEHIQDLAPTEEILNEYHKTKDWQQFEKRFHDLLEGRDPVTSTVRAASGHATVCLLCTEETPEKCHRRLVAEYLGARLPDVEVRHL